MRILADVVRDLRYGLRMLGRNPGFTAVAVLSLGLGIGANTAMFTAVDALMLRQLPVPDPEGLVLVVTVTNPPARNEAMNFKQLAALRRLPLPFSSVAGSWSIERSNLGVDSRPSGVQTETDGGQVRIGLATSTYFSTLGVTPVLGRTFDAGEDGAEGGHPLAVVSHLFWQRRLGGTADAIGRTFRLNGLAYEVIGVTPPGFSGEWVGMPTDLWVPFTMAAKVIPEFPGGANVLPARAIARLTPGVSRSQASAAMQLIYRQFLTDDAGSSLNEELAGRIARTTVELDAFDKGYSPQRTQFSQSLVILMAGVGLLLLVACANLANLLLARAASRRREIAVRLAIGAGRGRLVRQLFAESGLIAFFGGLAGLLFTVWGSRSLAAMFSAAPVSLSGQGTGIVLDMALGPRAILFAVLLSLLAGVLFGITLALSARVPLAATLRDSGTRVVGGAMEGPRSLLLVAQVAVSLVLLVGAGLFVRSLAQLRAQDLGFERHHELLAWTVPGQTGRQDATIAAFWHDTMERLAAIPGIESVGATNQAVLSGNLFVPRQMGVPMIVEGEPEKPTASSGGRAFISPGFFAALGVPFLEGRDFTERDDESAPPAVIINEAMAQFYFGNRPAVGQRVRFSPRDAQPTEIVGVVRDFVRGTPRSAGYEFNTYFSYRHKEALNRGAQSRLRIMMIAIRTAGDPLAMADRVRRELRAIDPELPVLRINSAEQQLDDVLAQDRLVAALSSSLGALAMLLACLGLFGLVSYRVARRTNEIGVRLALGAAPTEMVMMILRENLRLVGTGLIVGVVAALALARFVSARLYGISATDPWTIAAAVALLMVVALAAAFVPARRASTIDPVSALRCD